MGYQVEEYSVSELSRIALPGRVIPALFWALPIGEWDPMALDKCWIKFTQSIGPINTCTDFGPFLVKSGQRSRGTGEENEIYLDSKGANLTDLLPKLIAMPDLSSNGPKLLLMSGAYPQPGWALCIGLKSDLGEVASWLENLISHAVTSLCSGPGGGASLKLLAQAQTKYRVYNSILNSEPVLNQNLKEELDLLKVVRRQIERVYSCLSDGGPGLDSSLNSFRGAWNGVQTRNPHLLDKSVQELLGPVGIVHGQDHLRLLIASQLIEGKDIHDPTILKRLTKLEDLDRSAMFADPLGWAKTEVLEAKSALEKGKDEFQSIIFRRMEEADAEIEKQKNYRDQWNERLSEALKEFIPAIHSCIEALRSDGASFLVHLEDVARSLGAHTHVVAWDQARLIGWKLFVRGFAPSVADIAAEANTILGEHNKDRIPQEYCTIGWSNLADGSVLTDYVHYLITRIPELSARDLTLNFICKLYRQGDLERLIRFEGGSVSHEDFKPRIAEVALKCMGWLAPVSPRSIPLASCIEKDGGHVRLSASIIDCLSDLRVAMESFCKELILLLVLKKLPAGGFKTLGSLLQSGGVRLEPSSRSEPSKALSQLNLGGAVRWIEAILNITNSDKDVCSRLVASIDRLREFLNDLVHDSKPGAMPARERFVRGCPREIQIVLECSSDLIIEMPWHFSPSQTLGRFPRILIGNAWSHSYSTERILTILDTRQEWHYQESLVWNPSRSNPVITDPEFLKWPLS